MVDQSTERQFAVRVFSARDSAQPRLDYMADSAPVEDSRNLVSSTDGTSTTNAVISQTIQKDQGSGVQAEILQKMFDQIPLMISICGVDGQYQVVNAEWERRLGWSQDEILAQGHEIFKELFPDPQLREEAQSFMASACGEWRDFKTTARDGRLVDAAFTRMAISDSAHRRAEEAVLNAEQKYRDIFENTHEGIFQTTEDGTFLAANPAMARMLGYGSVQELLSNRNNIAREIYVDPARRDELKRLLQQRGSAIDFEHQAFRKNGVKIWISENVRAVRNWQGTILYYEGTAIDITERKHSRAVLQNFSRRLLDVQEAERQRLARELHDEIGQVLTAVRISMEAVQRAGDRQQLSAHIEDSLTVIDEALRQVRNLSLDLRPPHLDDFGLTSAVRWYIDRYAKRSGTCVRFVDEQPADLPRLRQDLETACFRILQEALTNVARHANAKNVSVRLARSNGHLLLIIEDDGAGFEVDSLRKCASANATLGVLGMEERAEAVGGRIEIESALGRGTKIRAQFPITRPKV